MLIVQTLSSESGKIIDKRLEMILAQTNDKITWVKVGQSFERVALTSTSLNIRMAHLNMPCEVVSVSAKLSEHLGWRAMGSYYNYQPNS